MTYHITYERDESGWWVATVKELNGCHTQGRTIAQARARIREAMGLFDVPAGARLEHHVRLPRPLDKAIAAAKRSRAVSQKAEADSARRLSDAVRLLEARGISRRDTAELVGLSHQRVQQIAKLP